MWETFDPPLPRGGDDRISETFASTTKASYTAIDSIQDLATMEMERVTMKCRSKECENCYSQLLDHSNRLMNYKDMYLEKS